MKVGRYCERNKWKSPFSTIPLSFDAPFQRTPANIHINLILLETGIPGLHNCSWQYGSIFVQIFVVDSKICVYTVTERKMAVQGQFRVNQAKWSLVIRRRLVLPVKVGNLCLYIVLRHGNLTIVTVVGYTRQLFERTLNIIYRKSNHMNQVYIPV